jgi:hypothetical protein
VSSPPIGAPGRAPDNNARARSPKRLALAACIVATVVIAVSLFVALRPEPSLGEKLADSLVDEGDGFIAVGPCELQGATRWRCEIEDDPGSGGSDVYLLELDAKGCWAGARTVDLPGDQPLSGCI